MARTLLEALEIIKKNRMMHQEKILAGALYSGIASLHLKTFFHSFLCDLSPNHRITLREGRYGDLLGSLLELLSEDVDLEFVAIVMEWEDLDLRLGLRSLQGWSIHSYEDILASVRSKVPLFSDCIKRLTEKTKVILSLPSSPFLPLYFSARRSENIWENALKNKIYSLRESLLPLKNFFLVNQEIFMMDSGFPRRYSVESHLACGFPYSLEFSVILAQALAELALPPAPLKGIVVDLDETLWKGILGEDGIEGVSWDLDRNSHMHGVFQAFLQSLAESGILVGVASKNDPTLVEELFSKRETPLRRDAFFPLMAGWGRKSVSIRKILEAWNVSADAVVFVDDSPLEIEEVSAEFPQLRTFLFPNKNAEEILNLIYTLRDLFGKETLSQEDSIRLTSLKQREEFAALSASGGENYEELLRRSLPRITLCTLSGGEDARAFELLNKTNQFNMNGMRCTETEWKALRARESGFVVVASYEDRFGLLGKIAVFAGYREGSRVSLSHWVMSCRAFGRRIEHAMLRYIFQKYDVDEVCLQYSPTARNAPFFEFAKESGMVEEEGVMRVERARFVERCPALYHEVKETIV
jgi:FkbH-like protein